MSEYMNPAAGLPDANFANNPFWSGVKSVERQQIMQPFMDMSQQRQQMDLQKQQVMNQEFMSPQARGARMDAFGEQSAKSRFNKEKAIADLELLPMEQKKRVAEISNAIRSEEAKPMTQLFEEMAGISDVLERTPEEHRPMVYKQWADRTQQKIGKPLPQQYQNYTPQFLNEAKNIKYGLVYTPKHEQKMAEIGLQGDNSAEVARISGENSERVARINQAGQDRRHKDTMERTPKPVNIPQRMVQLRDTMANPSASEQDKAVAKVELMGYLHDNFQNFVAKDPLLKGMAGMAGIPGKVGEDAKARYEAELATKWQAYLRDQKMLPQDAAPKPTGRVSVISPDGKVGTIPADQLDAALKNGYKKQ